MFNKCTHLCLVFSLVFSLFLIASFSTNAATSDHFITTWETTSDNTTITIPTAPGETYAYQVDWNGDGDFDDTDETTIQTGNAVHDYQFAGIHTIVITGLFPRIYFNFFPFNSPIYSQILSIEQWGTNSWSSMATAFSRTKNLVNNAPDTPNLSNCTSMSYMFSLTNSLGSASETGNWNWNTSTIQNMSGAFSNARVFNQDISNWLTNNVTDMSQMFAGTNNFNQDISGWQTSSVNNMGSMFFNAKAFNQPIGTWQTGAVTNMESMFFKADDFNQNLNGWDVSNVQDMYQMFAQATAFNQGIDQWQTTSVTEMSYMFYRDKIFNQDLSGWQTSTVTSMESMFQEADVFNQDLSNWQTQNVTNMSRMFDSALTFNQDLSGWNISSITANFSRILFNTSFTTANYDAMLISWYAQLHAPGLTLDVGSTQYCSQAAYGARRNLINNDGWEISDGGFDASCTPELIYANGFENIIIIKTTDKKAIIDFSQYLTDTLSSKPLLILIGKDTQNIPNLRIHLRIDVGQLQIRMSNKLDGFWQIGQWVDVYNQELTTIEWSVE